MRLDLEPGRGVRPVSLRPFRTSSRHPPCRQACRQRTTPHFGHRCKRQIGNAETIYRRPRTPRKPPPQAPPERGLAGQRALFRRLASVVITAMPPSPRPRRDGRGTGRTAHSVRPGVCPAVVGLMFQGGLNVKVCPNGAGSRGHIPPDPTGQLSTWPAGAARAIAVPRAALSLHRRPRPGRSRRLP